jgi:type 1 glutamine amidotransferase
MSPRAVILSGAGRYADPWHPFAETSAILAEIVAGEGFDVEIAENVDERLSDLSDVDLLVVNVGDPAGPHDSGVTEPPDPDRDDAARQGLLAYLARGKPLLSKHVSSTSFGFIPEWESIGGGVWVRGTTMHPDYGSAAIVVQEGHPITEGLADFETSDERYSWLRTADDVVPLLSHEHDGVQHPLLWARTYGSSRIVYDALGHDAGAYEAAIPRELVARSVRWLTGS